MDINILVGAIGAVVLLIAFVLEEIHKLSDESIVYDALNFIGAALLAVYAYLLQSIPFLILNTIWSLVALRDVFLVWRKMGKNTTNQQPAKDCC